MKRNFSTENREPTCRDGARARQVPPGLHQQNAFLIRVIREIRGFSFETRLRNRLLLPALIALLNLIPAGRVTAQTSTTLHSFTTLISNTNSDGVQPQAGLIVSGHTLVWDGVPTYKKHTRPSCFAARKCGTAGTV